MPHSIFEEYDHAWITSYWGWIPESWGCLNFTYETHREKYRKLPEEQFLMVVYITKSARRDLAMDNRGKVAGFYEISTRIIGDRDQFTDDQHHNLEPNRWRYSLKATRAFTINKNDRPMIEKFEPSIYEKNLAQSVAQHGRALSQEAFDRLKTYSITEVPVYGKK